METGSQGQSEHSTLPTLPIPGVSGWCLVELMGHRTRAGFVSEEVMFGEPFVRIDIPWRDPAKGKRATEHYRPGSVYGFSWCDEAAARQYAGNLESYSHQAPQLSAGPYVEPDDDDDLVEQLHPEDEHDHQFPEVGE